VTPRLCRPLETGGRSIRPHLIHGDLWDGNASFVKITGLPVILMHTACTRITNARTRVQRCRLLTALDELAPFVLPRHKMNRSYIEEYIKFYPPSESMEDFEDRLALYAAYVFLTL
jgi:protein-ribulosamine 3-kinase